MNWSRAGGSRMHCLLCGTIMNVNDHRTGVLSCAIIPYAFTKIRSAILLSINVFFVNRRTMWIYIKAVVYSYNYNDDENNNNNNNNNDTNNMSGSL